MDDLHIETVEKGEQNPRIILIGWLGSQMKYLKKYSKLWNEMNCTTINVIDTRNFFRQFFVPGRRAEVSALILKQLAKEKSSQPVIFHVFSNGGANIYSKLIKEIYQYNSVFNYQPIHVAGVIFDSCPGRPRPFTGMKAALLSTPFVLRFLVYFIWLFVSIPMILLKKFGRSWYEEIYESDTRFPQQFIYSTGDELINYEDIDDLVVRRKKMNKVFVQKFGSQSPHVAHLRHDEEKYTETINRFFKLAIGRNPLT